MATRAFTLPSALIAMAIACGTTPEAKAEPVDYSDSERTGDLFYWGAFGGVAFASLPTLKHPVESGGEAIVDDVGGAPSPVAGYQVAYWPFDYFGFDMATEGFGLALSTDKTHFDQSPTSYPLRMVNHSGGGFAFAPTLRLALPLYVIQPNVGGGILMPVTFIPTLDPKTRSDSTSFHVDPTARAVGGINVYVSRFVRIYAEYRFDYTLASFASDNLDTGGMIRHSVIGGFIVSPEDFRKLPKGERRLGRILPGVLLPAAFNVLFVGAIAAMKGNAE